MKQTLRRVRQHGGVMTKAASQNRFPVTIIHCSYESHRVVVHAVWCVCVSLLALSPETTSKSQRHIASHAQAAESLPPSSGGQEELRPQIFRSSLAHVHVPTAGVCAKAADQPMALPRAGMSKLR